MTEERASGDGSITMQGRQIELSNGAKVWGGLRDGGVVWRFVSKEGGVTSIALSDLAMQAVLFVYQGLIGCDEEFARVSAERQPQSEDGHGNT